ncbi:4069_t:CDS:1, partial [Racocetra fulgida]
EALGEVVYKYNPKPNVVVKVNEPEQVMIYKTAAKNDKVR